MDPQWRKPYRTENQLTPDNYNRNAADFSPTHSVVHLDFERNNGFGNLRGHIHARGLEFWYAPTRYVLPHPQVRIYYRKRDLLVVQLRCARYPSDISIREHIQWHGNLESSGNRPVMTRPTSGRKDL